MDDARIQCFMTLCVNGCFPEFLLSSAQPLLGYQWMRIGQVVSFWILCIRIRGKGCSCWICRCGFWSWLSLHQSLEHIVRGYRTRRSGGGYSVSSMKDLDQLCTSLGEWWVVLEQGMGGWCCCCWACWWFALEREDAVSVWYLFSLVFSSVSRRKDNETYLLPLDRRSHPPLRKHMRPQHTKPHLPNEERNAHRNSFSANLFIPPTLFGPIPHSSQS